MFHDPTHVFFKLPRPVDRPIESQFPMLPKLYVIDPVGHFGSSLLGTNCQLVQDGIRGFLLTLKVLLALSCLSNLRSHFTEYLKDLFHSTAICDRCMTCIQGAWFRCAYCGKDLCDACEELDNHNDTHLFMVFKAPVDVHAIK